MGIAVGESAGYDEKPTGTETTPAMSKKGRRGRSSKTGQHAAQGPAGAATAMETAFEEASAHDEGTPSPEGELAGAGTADDPAAAAAGAAEPAYGAAEGGQDAAGDADASEAVVEGIAAAAEGAEVSTEPTAAGDPTQVTATDAAEARRFDRDDSSYPPVDLDNHFFERSSHHSVASDEEEERDPRMALKRTAHVVQRRAQLTRYVKIAVAGASVLCLAALVKVAVARNADDRGAAHGSSAVAAVQPAPLPAKTTLPAA